VKRRPIIPLAIAIAASLFAGVLLLTSLLIYVEYRDTERQWVGDLQADAYNRLTNLQYTFQLLLRRKELASIQQIIETEASDPRVKRALLIGSQFRIIAADRQELIGSDVRDSFPTGSIDDLFNQVAEQNKIVCTHHPRLDAYVAIAPIRTNGSQGLGEDARAALCLVYDATGLRQKLRSGLAQSILLHTLMGLIFALLILLSLEQTVTRPIRQLATAIKQVESGNLSARAKTTQATEIGELAYAFNEMTSKLEAQQATIDRKQLELAQLYNETIAAKEQYRALVELAQEGIVIIDPDEVIRFANPAFARVLGYREEELLGRSLLTLVTEEGRSLLAEQTARRRKGESSHYELTVRAACSRLKTVLMSAVPLLNEQGEFIGSLAVCVDISELKQKEAALRESEQRFEDLYDHAPDGYHTLAADGTFIEINKTELEWLDYSRDEVVGKVRFTDLVDEPGKELFARTIPHLIRTGSVQNLEVEMVRKDGTRVPVRINATALYDQHGEFVKCRATVRDITEERALQRQLLQAQKLEAIGTLAGGIAHDFNNVLTGILGYTELVADTLDTNDIRRESLTSVLELARRAAGMVRQLLSFSREASSERAVLDIIPLAKETVRLLQRMIPETIDVELTFSKDALKVEADPAQLQQVLMNLCINARDAMPVGGMLSLSLSPISFRGFGDSLPHPEAQPKEYVRLAISDTGIGMSSEIQSRIFEPFFTTKEPGKGSGLGLSVVYGIVKAHGGFITVDSQVGTGSTFGIYLPATEGQAMEPEMPPPVAKTGSGEMVLLADDENVVLTLSSKILKTHGYRVMTAENGAEALEVYRQHQDEIDVVILDAMMPKVTGTQACQLIKEMDHTARVILVTGYSKDEAPIEEAIRLNGLHFVQKPYTAQQLVAAVREVLDKSMVA
jgi:PAS domain S-box-containing protein